MSTDADLFQQSVHDPEMFREVFERHAAPVLAYARKRLGPVAGDEILAQTFLTAFERRERFDRAYPSARPWLFGIATNIIRHYLREEREHLAMLGRFSTEVSEPPADDVEGLDAERLRPQLMEALLALSDVDRGTFLLQTLGELTYKETAHSLGFRSARCDRGPPGEHPPPRTGRTAMAIAD